MRTLIKILFISTILFAVVFMSTSEQVAIAQTGQKAAAFTLNDLNGNSFNSATLNGKVVILDFWATWCPPCRMEIPHFISLYNKYRDQGLEVIGIAMDKGGASDVRPFVASNGINYPILIGNRKVTADFGGIRGIPTTFVLDRQGNIIEKYVGYRDEKTFETAIQKLL